MKNFFLLFLILIAEVSYAQDAYLNGQVVHTAIVEEGRLVNQLDGSVPTDLPIGIGSAAYGEDYLIGIDSIVLSPGASYLSASAMVEIPASEELLVFSGSKVQITPNGIKGATLGKLNLAVDVPIKLNDKLKLTVKGNEGKTYVEFDCNGYVGLGVQGEFEFCRDLLIPVKADGKIAPESERVKAQFETRVNHWDNILSKVTMTPFQTPELPGFDFYVQDAWVDQSDVANPLSLIFPSGYKNADLEENDFNLWHGFFLKQLSVKLPKQFESKGSTERKEIQLTNALIDNKGFSGWINAKNVLPDGLMDGWPFTVSEMSIELACNKLSGAGFKGLISIPIAKKDQDLDYDAIIESGGSYYFNIKNRDTIDVSLWKAIMHLYPSTSVEVSLKDDHFKPKATLNGDLDFSPDLGTGDNAEFKGILFEKLIVSSTKPYITPGSFSYVSQKSKMSGYSFTINDIDVVNRASEDLIGLRVGLSLNLMEESKGGFSGKTDVTVFGKYPSTGYNKDNIQFHHVEVTKLKIDAQHSAFTIKGDLDLFRKDKTFGSGYRGNVTAIIQPGIEVKANAQFGNISDVRYWYVDALGTIPKGIKVVDGFAFYGFGGGLYHHMRRTDVKSTSKVINSPAFPTNDDATQSETSNVARIVSVEQPSTGVKYIPDANTHLGMKAAVVVGVYPEPETFNADLNFEIAFNDHSGVNYISLNGPGYLMTKIADRENPKVKADVAITMDLVNNALHSTMDVFVDIEGRDGTIHGIYPNNLAGSAVLHFEKDLWYLHVGTPDRRIALDFAGLFKANAYVMTGKYVPEMPAPPKYITDLLNGDYQSSRDEYAMGSGRGLCVGGSFDIKKNKKQFEIYFGEFDGGGGFDMNLTKYENDAVACAGTGPIGINGYYATGQAYAYLEGPIGITIDLGFLKSNIKIFDLGTAALLQAKLPNPNFLKGEVGGYYSILNGKIKGHCRFEFTMGQECQNVAGQSKVSSMKVISEITPKENDNKVNIFNRPQATFNLAPDKEYELQDLDGSIKVFRVKLDEFKLLKGADAISGTLDWNDAGDIVTFKPSEILPGNSTIKVFVKVSFEERKNGVWSPITIDGKIVAEVKEETFKTSDVLENIPVSNVKFSYPEVNQFNFLKSEFNAGYIQLKQGQDYLFELDGKWVRKVRFVKAGEKTGIETDLFYNTANNTITYSIPSNLENNQIYNLMLVKIPASKVYRIDGNVSVINANYVGDGIGGIASTETKSVNENRETLNEIIIYSCAFRTSKYSRFNEKMKALNISDAWTSPVFEYMGVEDLGVSISGDETFDKIEISGNTNTTKLINGTAYTNNSWYSRKVYPLVYQNYPVNSSINIGWRNPFELGIPPYKAIELIQSPADKMLTEGEVLSGVPNSISEYSQLVYKLPLYMYKDYADLQQKCAVLVANNQNVSKEVWNIVFNPFPQLTSGSYEVNLDYILPGINKVTSSYKLVLKNP